MGAVEGNPFPPNMGFEPNMGGFDGGVGLGVVLGGSDGAAGGVEDVLSPKRGGGDEVGAGGGATVEGGGGEGASVGLG